MIALVSAGELSEQVRELWPLFPQWEQLRDMVAGLQFGDFFCGELEGYNKEYLAMQEEKLRKVDGKYVIVRQKRPT